MSSASLNTEDDNDDGNKKCFSKLNIIEKLKECRSSRKLVLLIVFLALLLDDVLLGVVVPIMPSYLSHLEDMELTREGISSPTNTSFTPSIPVSIMTNSTCNDEPNLRTTTNSVRTSMDISDASYHKLANRRDVIQSSVASNPSNETSTTQTILASMSTSNTSSRDNRVVNIKSGLLFASKSVVQLLTNPCVGPMTNRIGYSVPMSVGFLVLFVSTIMFAFGESYVVLFIARSLQGFGSSCSSVSGLGMLATLYPDDKERGESMSIALSGLAFGFLIGPVYGGLFYHWFGKETPFIVLAVLIMAAGTSICFGNMGIAMLEPSLPLHMYETMNSSEWEQGIVFLPCSIAYLLGTSVFGPLAYRIGRWLSAMLGMIVIGVSLFSISFGTHIGHLIVPSAALGFAIGMLDTSMMPIMAHLVDLRHISVYGSVYAISEFAFCFGFAVGPAVTGAIVNGIGFKGLMWTMALICVVYSPLHIFLKNPPSKEEKQHLMKSPTMTSVPTDGAETSH